MKSRAFAGKLLVVGVLVLLGAILSKPNVVAAEAVDQNIQVQSDDSTTPPIPKLSIAPVCFNAAASTASWQVYSPSSVTTELQWATQGTATSHTGSYHTPGSLSTFTTYYEPAVTGVQFTYGSAATVYAEPTVACPTDPVPAPSDPCVDGSDKNNLVVTWLSDSQVSIHTVNHALLCDDVTVYFSSYILPANYNGSEFGEPTTYPQTMFGSNHDVLAAGTDGDTTLTIQLPESCNNSQVDVYYAPELTVVGQGGHGIQFISGYIIPSTGSCTPCPPPPTDQPPTIPPIEGGKGGGPLPTPPETPPIVVASAPVAVAPIQQQLTDTGTNVELTSFLAGTLIASALLVVTRRTKTSN